MELSFIVNALRRYKWIPIVFVILGGLAGFALDRRAAHMYSSEAILLVTPPSDSQYSVSFTNDPDRYAVGQLTLLRSQAVASQIAEQVGNGISAREVRALTTITHEPRTDVVNILATTEDAELSRDIVNGYVDVYFEYVNDAVADAQQPEIARIDGELQSIQTELAEVDAEIQRVMAPYLPTNPGSAEQVSIPTLDQVAPALSSRKNTLLSEQSQLQGSKTQFEINQRVRVTSQVIQHGTVAEKPDVSSFSRLYLGLVGGLFLGALLAVVLGRISTWVLDATHAAEILGQPLVGRFPRVRALVEARRPAFVELPPDATAFVDALCVRAEASAPPNLPFVVVVTGAARSSGTTTLAIAMASRYAIAGAEVLLVDADVRNPEITRTFARGRPGIGALVRAGTNGARPQRSSRPDAESGAAADRGKDSSFAPTPVAGLSVVGLDAGTSSSLHRHNVADIVDAARHHAQIVVFDGGPLMDSANAVRLAHLADAVVLAVPMARQRADALATLGQQIAASDVPLLVVDMPADRARREPEPEPPAAAPAEPRRAQRVR